ncbi:MAG TPA: hypothetical protein PK176_03020 [Acidobacteriota bacterium]|nr:hypothetical protein [Acidobacteriota bacterium]
MGRPFVKDGMEERLFVSGRDTADGQATAAGVRDGEMNHGPGVSPGPCPST